VPPRTRAVWALVGGGVAGRRTVQADDFSHGDGVYELGSGMGGARTRELLDRRRQVVEQRRGSGDDVGVVGPRRSLVCLFGGCS
jgi:hypothetical protein